MAKFLAGKELEEAICDLIYNAKRRLLIISPFIKLDEYFRKAVFNKHLSNAELELVIIFGKNKGDINRSLNKEDFEYFKNFPNISIVYVPNLHAKYYANERRSIITSLNLYDSSFKQNIEFGIISEPTIIGGEKLNQESWEESMNILTKNCVIFVRKPNFRKRLLGKDYVGSETVYDVIDQLIEKNIIPKKTFFDFKEKDYVDSINYGERQSREEFNKSSEPSAVAYNNQNFRAFCIRCKILINLNINRPFCDKCSIEWERVGDERSKENFCHVCGKPHKSSKKFPSCYDCYKKITNSNSLQQRT